MSHHTNMSLSDLERITKAVKDEATSSFATAFASVPNVVAGFADNSTEISVCRASSVTNTGFTIGVQKSGGGSARDRDVAWIATNAGNT